MSHITITGTIVTVQRYVEKFWKRDANGIVTDSNGQPIELERFARMILVESADGQRLQWFGKPDTAFWQHFSSKADSPLKEGQVITVTGKVKRVQSADQHFGERTVVTHPKLIRS